MQPHSGPSHQRARRRTTQHRCSDSSNCSTGRCVGLGGGSGANSAWPPPYQRRRGCRGLASAHQPAPAAPLCCHRASRDTRRAWLAPACDSALAAWCRRAASACLVHELPYPGHDSHQHAACSRFPCVGLPPPAPRAACVAVAAAVAAAASGTRRQGTTRAALRRQPVRTAATGHMSHAVVCF